MEKQFLISESDLRETLICLDNKKTYGAKAILRGLKEIKEEDNFEIELCSEGKVKDEIKKCEGKHIQQIAYSSYHDALTQICFGCKKIRTSLKKEDLK